MKFTLFLVSLFLISRSTTVFAQFTPPYDSSVFENSFQNILVDQLGIDQELARAIIERIYKENKILEDNEDFKLKWLENYNSLDYARKSEQLKVEKARINAEILEQDLRADKLRQQILLPKSSELNFKPLR